MLITNAGASEQLAEGVAIVLGVGTRARHGPHVDDHVDFRTSQQGDEFRDWARRMTNREDLISDGRLLIVSIATWHGEFSCYFSVEPLIDESNIDDRIYFFRGRTPMVPIHVNRWI